MVGKSVYAFVRRGGREVMLSLDASTGEELWSAGYSAPYSPGQPAAAHGAGPKATPSYRDGKLFTLGVSGIVAAFDASDGRLLWKTEPPAEPPYFGAASSPIAGAGVVIAHPGNYGPLTAFDAATGEIEWTAGDGGFFASPVLARIDGVRQVISVTREGVIGVALPAGRLLWRHPSKGGQGGPTPVMHGDAVIVSGNNLGTAAFRPVLRNGTWITETLWETDEVSMYLSTPVVIANSLFGLSQRSAGQYFALDATTGQVLWLGPSRAAENTAVAKAGDLIFLLNEDAELIVARGNRKQLEPLRRYTVAQTPTWAQPAISGRRLFVKDVGSLGLWTLDWAALGLLPATLLVVRSARTGRAEEKLAPVLERHVPAVGPVGAVLGLVSVHDDDLADLDRVPLEATAKQAVRGPALDHPDLLAPVLGGHFQVDPRVRVHPLDPDDGPFEHERPVGIEFRSERVVGVDRDDRGQHDGGRHGNESGRNALRFQFACHGSLLL